MPNFAESNQTSLGYQPEGVYYFIFMRKTNCKCCICQKLIYRRPSQLNINKVYCSVKCSGIDQRKIKICPICSIEFTGSKKTCSRGCSNKNRIGNIYDGKNSNNKYIRGKKIKEKLALNNNGLCYECGNDNYNILHVHHKLEKCNGGGDDLNNLILLCPNCHYTHHYGYQKWNQ